MPLSQGYCERKTPKFWIDDILYFVLSLINKRLKLKYLKMCRGRITALKRIASMRYLIKFIQNILFDLFWYLFQIWFFLFFLEGGGSRLRFLRLTVKLLITLFILNFYYPYLKNLEHFKLKNSVRSNGKSLKYQTFTRIGCTE